MRTTITIDDDLLNEVRKLAAELRQTVSQVIEDSVRATLLRHGEEPREAFRVRAVDTGGYQPGVTIDDNSALLDLMDRSR